MKLPALLVLASTATLGLSAALPHYPEPAIAKAPTATERFSSLNVYPIGAGADSAACNAASVLSVRAALTRVVQEARGFPLPKTLVEDALRQSFPGAVGSEADTIGYTWRWVEDEWVLVCLQTENFSVRCDDTDVGVQLSTEM